jgi:O-antigen ligase
MAAALVMAVALAGNSAWRAPSPKRPHRPGEGGCRRLWRVGDWSLPAKAGVVLALLAGLASSGTRSSAMAALVGVALALLASRRRAVVLQVVVVAGLATAVALVALPRLSQASRIAYRVGQPAAVGAMQRVIGWRLGMMIAARHPVWGAGPGANAAAFPALSRAPAFVVQHVEGAFNAYVQALMETGPLGLVGLVGLVALPVAAALRAYRRAPAAPSATITLACACGLAAVAVTGLTGPLIITGVGHLFFLLAGLTVAGVRVTEMETHAR